MSEALRAHVERTIAANAIGMLDAMGSKIPMPIAKAMLAQALLEHGMRVLIDTTAGMGNATREKVLAHHTRSLTTQARKAWSHLDAERSADLEKQRKASDQETAKHADLVLSEG